METLASPAAISGGSGRVSPLEISPIRRVDIVGSQERSLDGGIARLSAGKIRLENSLLLGKGNWRIYILSEIFVQKKIPCSIFRNGGGGKGADRAARTQKPAQREIKSAADRFSRLDVPRPCEAGFFFKEISKFGTRGHARMYVNHGRVACKTAQV